MAHTTTTTDIQTVAVAHLDPAALLVDRNVRHDPRLDRDFVASIKEHGVLVPIVAVRTADGDIRVRHGHRRTLAAAQAGRTTVPVVIAADEATDDAAEVDRLVGQYVENVHRTGLSNAERIDVAAQLSAFGVTAAQITRRTRMPRAEVDAALTVASSDLAKAATLRYDLDLAQAAVLAEFEDDAETVKALLAAARTGQFDHVAQRARDRRDEAVEREARAVVLRETGVAVLDQPGYDSPAERLSSLTDDRDTREPLTVDRHAVCPGHAAYLIQHYTWVPAAGDQAGDSRESPDHEGDEDLSDERDHDERDHDERDHDEREDEDDEVHAADDGDEGRQERTWTPVYVCVDPAKHGHAKRYDYGSPSRTPAAQ